MTTCRIGELVVAAVTVLTAKVIMAEATSTEVVDGVVVVTTTAVAVVTIVDVVAVAV